MATTATARKQGALQRRRIIERPRLCALLDGSKARVRTLIAPAGYGKTTLAEQWVGRDGRRGPWFTARRASTDVAALALGLARASTDVVPGCDDRLREHLRALPAPADNIEVLAEILGEDLESWPPEAWLVLDEYQEIAGAGNAERFVAALVAASPVQLLIASRQRPAWVTSRTLLYGEAFELTQADLAMDAEEAAEVLAERSAPSASGLVALANGWPAVIGLASVSTAEIDDRQQVPESLYRFFAEEVFRALGDEVQAGLGLLAVAPVLDRELAAELLGADSVDSVCPAALDVGILVERGTQLELHPLARAFLEERSEHLALSPSREAAERCLAYYRRRRDWDAAFDLITRRGLSEQLEPVLLEALDELLDSARLSTIEAWCALAAESKMGAPVFSLARSEVALRHGRLAEAQAYAEKAAIEPSILTFRALSTAGRAAHLASREEKALELYGRAETAASTEMTRREALWGQLICAIELELPEAAEMLEQLNASVRLSDPRDAVRSAACGLNYQLKFGSLDLAEADLASELVEAMSDPLVSSSFQGVYSNALALSARYVEALEVATAFLAVARRYRLDFAMPYAHCSLAMACAGLREWQRAEQHLDEALAAARAGKNAYAEQVVYAVRVRTLTQEGRVEMALSHQLPSLRSSLSAARAEVLCSRALGLASIGRSEEALSLVQQVQGSTHAIESAVLCVAVEAIAALKRRDKDALDHVTALEEKAFTTGAVDLLVAAYRSAPELLAVLLRSSRHPERLAHLIREAHDEDLARTLGHSVGVNDDPRFLLSPREREVYGLLREGLTNLQIASVLFITEGTVKVHAHHIYDKLGIRSRTALAIRAALERADQATS
ncbi:MAG: LuxR C-terminal-related transcriptional regulator, partial [Actinomycetota bacterium]|nr:LuxR C-terminal-related transcriptional regulator [Actinomycetota bacterium]